MVSSYPTSTLTDASKISKNPTDMLAESPDPGPVQRDGAAQTRQAASDRNFGCHSFQTTEQLPAAEDSVNLDSYWTMDGIVDTGQLCFDPFATTTSEIDHYVNFFADLGQ